MDRWDGTCRGSGVVREPGMIVKEQGHRVLGGHCKDPGSWCSGDLSKEQRGDAPGSSLDYEGAWLVER